VQEGERVKAQQHLDDVIEQAKKEVEEREKSISEGIALIDLSADNDEF